MREIMGRLARTVTVPRQPPRLGEDVGEKTRWLGRGRLGRSGRGMRSRLGVDGLG